MNVLLLSAAALRTVPMALCLPLPGLAARLAFGLVLALFGAALPQDASLLSSMTSGVGLALLVLLPVWAARWAGGIVGHSVRVPALDALFSTLAWLAFFAAGGPVLLLRACAVAPPALADSIVSHGARFVVLAASLALPTLLALALLELLAAVAERFERAAESPLHARRLTHATRPIVACVLLTVGLASLTIVVEKATLDSAHAISR